MGKEIIFSRSALRQFKRLSWSVQKRIDEKLRFYLAQANFLRFAEPVKDSRFGSWKFRIGEYRVLFDIEKEKILILRVGHRKDIYK